MKSSKLINITLIFVLAIVAIPVNSVSANGCLPANVAIEAELVAAINCYNAETVAQEYVITFIGNIALTAATPSINNANAGVSLLIEGSNRSLDGQDTWLPFSISGSTTVKIQNLTITNGKGSYGGAIYNTGTLTLDNVTISSSYAGAFGGGIYNTGMITSITDSTFTGNDATNSGAGGAIYNDSGTISQITDSTFTNNIANQGAGIYLNGNGAAILTLDNVSMTENDAQFGGAINLKDGSITLQNNTKLEGNEGTSDAGGIIMSNDTSLIVDNSSISNNPGNGITGIDVTVMIKNGSQIDGNTNDHEGGGIYITGSGSSSTLTIDNSSVSGNTAGEYGGGIYFEGGPTVTIKNGSQINNNTVTDADYDGGGILMADGALTITDSEVNNNKVSGSNGDGGGIYLYSGSLSLLNGTISTNTATNNGGGIYNDGSVTITTSTISGNSADNYGGGIYNAGTITLIETSTISENTADPVGNGIGAGIYNASAGIITNVNNSTFSGNSAGFVGGAIYNEQGSPSGVISSINNSTIFGNLADFGGGIYVTSTMSGTITNTIIANNGNNCFSVPNGTNSITDSSGCDTWTDKSLVPASHLGPLADNGGPTKTHALLFTTPANPAINTAGTGATTTDQRGVSAVSTRDIGAFEYTGDDVALTVTVTNPANNSRKQSVSQLTVTFNKDVLSGGSANAADNADNYLLVFAGANNTFDTISCAGGVSGDDVKINISNVTYNSGNFTSTLTLAATLATAADDGDYRLFTCGTTSIYDTIGLELNGGLSDSTSSFTITSDVQPLAPKVVPTMSTYMLLLTTIGVIAIAGGGLFRRRKPQGR